MGWMHRAEEVKTSRIANRGMAVSRSVVGFQVWHEQRNGIWGEGDGDVQMVHAE